MLRRTLNLKRMLNMNKYPPATGITNKKTSAKPTRFLDLAKKHEVIKNPFKNLKNL